MAQAKVVTEYYRLVGWVGEYKVFQTFEKSTWKEMYWKALDTIRQHDLASIIIERVTVWEVNVAELKGEDRFDLALLDLSPEQKEGTYRGETVTGTHKISIPQHMPAELSRMDAVNGWIVPDTIEI